MFEKGRDFFEGKEVEFIFDAIPTYGDLIPLYEFVEMCLDGSFIDYDGFGYFATETKKSDVSVSPSDIKSNTKEGLSVRELEVLIKNHITHVVWFNR